MIPIKYTGAVLDTSGYASACRNYLGALIDSGKVDITVGVASFEKQKTTHGPLLEKIKPLINKPLKYDIHIVHLTPDLYPAIKEKGKYNIGYTVWETDSLPDKWVHYCNMMNEIWVPSDWNVKVFKESGVKVPIKKIPHGIAQVDLSDKYNLTIADDDTYVFYSIFQWIERKNPVSLLKAYLTEFNKDEKVTLALKSYRINTGAQEKEAIKNDIKQIKTALRLSSYPPILFFGQLLPATHMKGLHDRGDCFVLAHRGEGFGIPHAEAMSYGNPVIATGYSGNMEFMNNENSFPVRYQETPVSGMIFPNYHGHMTWAEPDIIHMRKLMRYCFENRKEAKKIGLKGQKYIVENLNWARIGNIITDRLNEIRKITQQLGNSGGKNG